MEFAMLLTVPLCAIREKNIEKFDDIIHTCMTNIIDVIEKKKIGNIDSVKIEDGTVNFRLTVEKFNELLPKGNHILLDILNIYGSIEETVREVMKMEEENIYSDEIKRIFILNMKEVEKAELVGDINVGSKNSKLKL